MSLYEKAWQDVQSRIARAAQEVGRDPAAIRLLAVSKEQPAAAIRAAYALGQRAFGENYVQEAAAKAEALADLTDIEWHLIGPLQSNKSRVAAQRFSWVHTIDRAKIAGRLSEARGHDLPPLEICVQVNISGEASKSGVAPDAALDLLHAIAPLLFEAARAAGLPLDTLSMGMSADLEAAIAEGATLVRVGTALFGARSAETAA
jgi:pyridoxal phosphate enzyme (YggS family)